MFFGGFFCRESSGPQAERLQSSVGGNSNQTTPDRHKNDSKNKSKYKWEQKWKAKTGSQGGNFSIGSVLALYYGGAGCHYGRRYMEAS